MATSINRGVSTVGPSKAYKHCCALSGKIHCSRTVRIVKHSSVTVK